MKNKKVFISGGAGVIGRELVSLLIEAEADIFVGDLQTCPKEFQGLIKYRQGDLNAITRQELEDFSPEIFFHLAATFERSTETYEFWDENYQNNIQLTHHLVSLIKDLKTIKKIIFASSYLIYDPKLYQFKTPQDKPVILSESDPIYPRNLTGVAKLSHEIDLRFLDGFKRNSYQTISARIYRGYGCNSRDVISRWIRDLILDKPIFVYKEEGIFDYIYAADSAKGLLKLSQTNNFTGIVNLGTGKARKVRDVLEILKKYFPNMKIKREEENVDYEASQANIDLLKKVLNWTPEYSLESAIPLIINFEKKKSNLVSHLVLDPKILITSSGSKPLLIKEMQRALVKLKSDIKLICGDSNSNCIAKFIVDDFWKMPKTTLENFEKILSGLIEKKINIVLPSRDGELVFWAANKEKFKSHGISIIISDLKSIKTCLDKLGFYKFGLSNNFNFIHTSEDINNLNSSKFVVKERYGAGSKSIGLNLSYDEAIIHSKTLNYPIFQPYIEGIEISADAWLDQFNKVKGVILRKRDLVIDGEAKVSTTFVDLNIENQVIQILENLKLSGPVLLQGILQKNGKIIFIECNTRFGGASSLSIKAGLDSLYWSILEIQGENLNDYEFHKPKVNIRKIRIQEDIFF